MPAQSAEEMKAIARRFLDELYNKGNTTVVDEQMTPNFVYHTAEPPITRDSAGVIQEARMLRSAFPDLRFTIDEMVVEGDKMMVRWTMSGTHDGDFYGVQPTHKQVTWSGIGSAQMSDGKNVAWWNFPDEMGLMQKLGAIPQLGIAQQPGVSQAQPQQPRM